MRIHGQYMHRLISWLLSCQNEAFSLPLQHWEGAIQSFTSLLDLQKAAQPCERMTTLANRAAAYLSASLPAACLLDCDAALTILLTSNSSPSEQQELPEPPREPYHHRPIETL